MKAIRRLRLVIICSVIRNFILLNLNFSYLKKYSENWYYGYYAAIQSLCENIATSKQIDPSNGQKSNLKKSSQRRI